MAIQFTCVLLYGVILKAMLEGFPVWMTSYMHTHTSGHKHFPLYDGYLIKQCLNHATKDTLLFSSNIDFSLSQHQREREKT